MAQLKDTIIQGDARVTDTLYSNTVNASTLSATNLAANKLTLNTNSNDVVLNLDQLDYVASDGTSYAKISTSTYGTLGIFSKRLIAICPAGFGDANGSTAASNTYQNTDGVYIDINRMWPIKNNSMSLGISNYKWSDLYATLISPDKIRINTTSTTSQNLYVNGTVRVYLGSSNISVTDRKFTIAGGNTSQYEISIGGEAIQAYNASQVAKNLFFQPYSGDVYIGSSGDTLAASALLPNRNNRHNIGSTTYKWANIYATNLNGLLNVSVLADSTTGNETYRSTFLIGAANKTGGNQELYIEPLVRTYTKYNTSKTVESIEWIVGRQSGDETGIPGCITLYGGNQYITYIKPNASLTATRTLTLPNASGTVALTSDITASAVGLGNVENTKLSTWTGSSNITTIGTLSSGAVPWARLSNIPDAATNAKGVVQIGTGLSVSSGTISVIYGNVADTACAGNDSRLSDAREPTAHKHGVIDSEGILRNTSTNDALGNRIPYTNNDGFLTTTSNLTYSSNTLYSKIINVSYHSSSASNQEGGLNLVNGSTVVGHIGASSSGIGVYHSSAIYLRPSLSGTTKGLSISAASIAPSTDGATLTTTDAMSLGASNKRWTNVYATLITPSPATYTTTTTAGIVFYNGSNLCAHIGASTGGAVPGSMGIQTTGQIVFRAGVSLSGTALDGDYGMNLTSAELAPKTNAAALDTTGALTLGSNTAQWSTTYTKQLTVDQHVTLAYNSSDLSLNFNFS